MGQWQEMELGDFLELKRGYDLPKKDRESGDVPLVSSSGVTDTHSESKVKGPGVVTGRYGTIGQVFYVEDDFWPLNTTLYVKDFKGNDPLFTYYFLKTINYLEYSDKAAVPGVNRNHLHKAKINVPIDTTEQHEIALRLWHLDQKIGLNTQINQTLEQIIQAIFKSWFVDFEPVKAKKEAKHKGQDPEFAAMRVISGKTDEELDALSHKQRQQLATTAALFPDELEDSELGEIPCGWHVSTLGEYADFQNGYAFKSKDWQEDGLPVVKIGSVKPGLVDLSGSSFVSEETVAGLEQFKLNPGDLLVGMTGYPGETGLVPLSEESPYLNQRVGRVKPVAGHPESYTWIYASLRDSNFKLYAESRAHGSAQANVSGTALMEYPVCFPGKDLVSEFHEKLHFMVSIYLENSFQSLTLSSIRDSLLPKLINGDLNIDISVGA